MNASYEDVKMMTNIFKPKYFMPIRSLYKDFVLANRAAIQGGVNPKNTIIADNGDLIEITKKSCKIKNKLIETSDIFANNSNNEDVASTVLDERRRLSTEGVLIIGATINRYTKLLVSSIDTQMRGIVFIKDFATESTAIQKIIEAKLLDKQKEFQNTKSFDINEVKKELKSMLYTYVRKKFKKMPIILTIVNEI